MSNILSIKDLDVVYGTANGRLHVLREVSLEIAEGEIMAIVGESGCGKSTLVNALISLLPDNAEIVNGTVEIAGTEMTSLKGRELNRLRSRELGVVFQDPFSALDPLYRIERQFYETLNIKEKVSKEQAHSLTAAMLRSCGIADPEEIMRKYPDELSGGLRQRVMIAMALINEPKLLIADEPTTALDVTVQKEILDLLKKLAKEKQLVVLFVTHSLDVAATIADRISVFYAGRVVEHGRTGDIFHFPMHPYTQALLKTIPSIEYGKRERKLMPIEGEMFSFRNDDVGCSFAPRCPYATDKCFNNVPEEKGTETHRYRCMMEEVW